MNTDAPPPPLPPEDFTRRFIAPQAIDRDPDEDDVPRRRIRLRAPSFNFTTAHVDRKFPVGIPHFQALTPRWAESADGSDLPAGEQVKLGAKENTLNTLFNAGFSGALAAVVPTLVDQGFKVFSKPSPVAHFPIASFAFYTANVFSLLHSVGGMFNKVRDDTTMSSPSSPRVFGRFTVFFAFTAVTLFTHACGTAKGMQVTQHDNTKLVEPHQRTAVHGKSAQRPDLSSAKKDGQSQEQQPRPA